jgi:hypothetical protein
MIHINKFIEIVSLNEQRRSKDIVLPMSDARGLRDELAKLLGELYQRKNDKEQEVVKIEIKGGKFK